MGLHTQEILVRLLLVSGWNHRMKFIAVDVYRSRMSQYCVLVNECKRIDMSSWIVRLV